MNEALKQNLKDLVRANGRALFVGPSGSGKRVAAQKLADRAGRTLHRVSLDDIVSQYIGETEKNLSRILSKAEAEDVILFFDEADGIFSYSDADASQGYLLGRIESYPGVVILSVKSKSQISPYHLRRFRLILDFPL